MPARSAYSIPRLIAAAIAIILVNACGGSTTDPGEDPTINLTLAPTSATVVQGGSVLVTGTATVGGSFSGTAAVSVANVPTGVTGAVGTPTVNGNVTTVPVTLTVGASVPPAVYSITVRVAGSGVSDEETFTLTVTPGPSFTLDVSPATLSIEQGTSDDASVTLVRTNFTGTVNLSASGAPAGMTVAFNPTAVTGTTSGLTVTVSGSVAASTYSLIIRGQATGTSVADRTDTLSVTVTAPAGPAYSISVTPDSLVLDQAAPVGPVEGGPARASSGAVTVGITRINDHSATVALDLLGAPEGVTATFSPAEVTGAGSELTVSVGPSVTPGVYATTIRGQDGALSERTTTLKLVIGAAPGYALSPTPTELSIEKGATGTTTIALARTNFTGAVTLSLEGAPSGVTGAFSVNPATGATSVLTLTTTAGAAVGATDLTIRGTTTALDDVTVPLGLTITEPVGFSLGSIAGITIQQGATGTRTVAINRTGGFAGAVAITVTPTVTGLTMTADPTSATGASFVLTAVAGGSLTPQAYTFEVKGNATGQPESVTSVVVTVTAASSNNVSLDYTQCSTAEKPIWFAFKDGAGSWTRVTGTADVYTFNVTQATAGVAIAREDAFSSDVQVAYMTQAEITNNVFLPDCSGTPTTKTVPFVATGLTATEGGILYLGGGAGFFTGTGSSFQVANVPLATQDAVAFVQDIATPGAERIFLRRNQDVTNLGTIDFSLANSEVVAAASATITVGGLTTGESYGGTIGFNTSTVSNVCQPVNLSSVGSTTASTFSGFGVPSGSQQSDESHTVSLAAGVNNNVRTVFQNIGSFSATTVNLPAALPAPTITDVGGTSSPYKILSAVIAMPNDYDSYASFEFDANGKGVGVAASAAYLGSGSQTFTVPDLSGVSGFQASWAPAATDEVSWGIFASGGFLLNPCTPGYRGTAASIEGTQN